jgi:hypothetical protein
MRSCSPLSTSKEAMATAASCCVSSATGVLGVTARFVEGVFFTELGVAAAATRSRTSSPSSGRFLRGPIGCDLQQALAAISGFYSFHVLTSPIFVVATFRSAASWGLGGGNLAVFPMFLKCQDIFNMFFVSTWFGFIGHGDRGAGIFIIR